MSKQRLCSLNTEEEASKEGLKLDAMEGIIGLNIMKVTGKLIGRQ